LVERWIDESYRSLAPKQLVNKLPVRGRSVPGATKTAKNSRRKKLA
jgi:hypothetical protein